MANVLRIDLGQPRSVPEILAATVRVYRHYPLLFAILALAVVAPYKLAVLAVTGYGPLRYGRENAGISWLLVLLESGLITPLISALHMHAVVAIGEGRRPRLGAVALRGLRVLPVVAAAEIVANVGIFLGFIALVVPGVVLGLRWAVVAQAAAFGDEGWQSALHRSKALTIGHYRHVLGLLLFIAALGFGVNFGARELPLGSTTGLGSVTVGIVVYTLIASFSALTLALLYFDLRARYESVSQPEPQPRPLPPGRLREDLRPRTVRGLAVLVGGSSAAFVVATIVGLIKRLDGHHKPALATLLAEVVIAAVLGAVAALARRPAGARSAFAVRLLMLVTWLVGALAVLVGIVTVVRMVKFAEGHVKPTLGALFVEILFTAAAASCATLAHRESRRRSTA